MSELSVGQLKGLPVNSNVITVPTGETLYAPGHVVQTVTSTQSTIVSTTSTSFVAANLSAAITPKFATSKILIIVSAYGRQYTNDKDALVTLFRGTISGTNLAGGTAGLGSAFAQTAGLWQHNLGFTFLDSPETTAETTYTVALRSPQGTQMTINNTPSNITLMEIAA